MTEPLENLRSRIDKMIKQNTEFTDIDGYISNFPIEVQEKLTKIRSVIREAAPDAIEKISYQMPTFAYEGNLVHFAAHKNHIGFYPTPSGIEKFRQELSNYPGGRGSVQFPLDRPIPYDLIREITRFRYKENREKAESKRKIRT